MRRTLSYLLLGLTILALAPTTASAHIERRWYWHEARAEAKLEHTYDASLASCFGRGSPLRKRGEDPLYKHFDCTFYDSEFDRYSALLHVLSRDRFKITYR